MFHLGLGLVARRFAKKMNLPIGGEFQAAYQAAQEVHARVILGDRPVQV